MARLKPELSIKRVAINRANAQMVGIVAGASFVTIFCLVASSTVWGQTKYQAKVTKAKTAAHQTLIKNVKNYATLSSQYQAFVSESTNILGGSPNGTGNNDGTNDNIVLDALPSSYDFPALASSLEKILTQNNFTVSNISGTDDQVAQQTNIASENPTAVPIPFTVGVTNATYTSTQQLMKILASSIRPIQIDTMSITGSGTSQAVNISAHTFYQPGKSLNITSQVVK